MTATNAAGSNLTIQTNYINVSVMPSPPVANFSANITYGAAPLTIRFTDTSNGSLSGWNWSFGDGTFSDQQNPVYIYRSQGLYDVSLQVTNLNNQNSTITRPGYIEVLPTLVPDFTGDPQCGPSPLTVRFTDTSTGPHDRWTWTFGDSGTSLDKNPLYTYNEGSYNVSLFVDLIGGGAQGLVNKYGYIRAIPKGVTEFTASNTSGYSPLTVRFNDTSTGYVEPVTYLWDFGDGQKSTDKNPLHVYSTSSASYTYPVTLTVSGYCKQTQTTSQFITVESPPPVSALFTSDVIEGVMPLTVNFKDTSSGNPVAWLWNFGDGSTSSSQNPSHTFTTSGLYSVTLEVTSAQGVSANTVVPDYIGSFASSHDLVFNTPGLSGTTDIVFDTSVFATAGGSYSLNGPVLTLDYPAGSPFRQLVISLDPASINQIGSLITGHVASATLETQDLDGSLVTGAEKHTIVFSVSAVPPSGSVVQTDTIENADPQNLLAFETLAAHNNMRLLDTCYEMFIGTTIPASTISSMGIKMMVPDDWYTTYRSSTISIIGVNSAGDAAILSTGTPTKDGDYVLFSAPSFSGYDTFGIAAFQSLSPPPSDAGDSGDTAAPSAANIEQEVVQNIAPAPVVALAPQPVTEQLAPAQEGDVASQTMDLTLEGSIVTTTSPRGEPTVTIDMAQAENTGATVTMTETTVTIVQSNFVLVITAEQFTEVSGIITGQDVQSVTFTSLPLQGVIPNVGKVSSSVKAGLPSVPEGAMITTTLSEAVNPEVVDTFRVALAEEGRELIAVAYTLTVIKTNIDATLPATITMTCPPDWITTHGGINSVSIVRIGDDGKTHVLETTHIGNDNTGNMVFEAVSPRGLSIFGLITAKFTDMKRVEDPNATIIPLSQPAMSTNIGMISWGLATVQQNPLIILIIIALTVLFVYVEWWRRRL